MWMCLSAGGKASWATHATPSDSSSARVSGFACTSSRPPSAATRGRKRATQIVSPKPCSVRTSSVSPG